VEGRWQPPENLPEKTSEKLNSSENDPPEKIFGGEKLQQYHTKRPKYFSGDGGIFSERFFRNGLGHMKRFFREEQKTFFRRDFSGEQEHFSGEIFSGGAGTFFRGDFFGRSRNIFPGTFFRED
jgi:hypothetical protein